MSVTFVVLKENLKRKVLITCKTKTSITSNKLAVITYLLNLALITLL